MAFSQSTTEIADLLARLDRGDPEATNLLIERCRERFRRRAKQMLGDFPKLRRDVDTSDVEQELHLRLCKTLRDVKVNDARHLLRLANVTIRRCLIDWARKKKPVAEPQDEHTELVDSHDGPPKAAILAEIHTWIGTLPDEQQEVFDLVFYQELTQEDAARVLGKSRKAVMRLVRDIKLQCIRKFGEDFI